MYSRTKSGRARVDATLAASHDNATAMTLLR